MATEDMLSLFFGTLPRVSQNLMPEGVGKKWQQIPQLPSNNLPWRNDSFKAEEQSDCNQPVTDSPSWGHDKHIRKVVPLLTKIPITTCEISYKNLLG